MSVNQGEILLPIARSSISEALGQPLEAADNAAWLQDKAACFVTLTQQQQLRGCIGTLEAHRSLLEDVKSNARAAAFQDPRFTSLTAKELSFTDIEISLLSATQLIDFLTEQEALAQLRPDIDGVVFEYGVYRSTFLPQVWQQLPDTAEFVAHLKHKAGLSPDFWADEVKLSRYTVTKWREQDLSELYKKQAL